MASMRFALLLLGILPAFAQPFADYHQHFFHPKDTGLSQDVPTITATELVPLLDAAGIRKAIVLSVAYQFGNPNRPAVDHEYAKVRAENDWTSAQVARFPDRLVGFCGVNPLRDYAVEEIARCAKDPHLHRGLKLHFGNSDVQLEIPDQLERVRRAFREANRHRMAIVVHMHANVNRKRPYGTEQARIFLEKLLPEAPDVPVQIAHLAGAGSFDDDVDEALGVFAAAIAHHDKRMANVYFDISIDTKKGDQIATRIRQLGLQRILFASDGALPGNSPKEVLAKFHKLPLTDEEFRTIESNVAPYGK